MKFNFLGFVELMPGKIEIFPGLGIGNGCHMQLGAVAFKWTLVELVV